MKLATKYVRGIDRQAIDEIEWSPQGAGEAGWTIYLKPGWCFWPSGLDAARWVPASNPEEA